MCPCFAPSPSQLPRVICPQTGAALAWFFCAYTRRCTTLVLSRRKSQKIHIGGGITVVVVQILSDKVRLGVEAPTETFIHRDEVCKAILRRGGELETLAADLPDNSPEVKLARRIYSTLNDEDGAVLVISGASDFVRQCRDSINAVARDGQRAQILAIGLDATNLEGTNDDERVA